MVTRKRKPTKRAAPPRVKPRRKASSDQLDALSKAFADQSKHCRKLGSPFMELLCDTFASNPLPPGPVQRKIHSWTGDTGALADAVPLRMAAALHGLVLEGKADELIALYPTNDPTQPYVLPDPKVLWAAVNSALTDHKLYVLSRLESAPQTNEVRRSAMVMTGLLHVASKFDQPIDLFELGASAGLNLYPDAYAHNLGGVICGSPDSPVQLNPKWKGKSPPKAFVRIGERHGCDLNPIGLTERDQQLRLLSYLWPDQHDRIARTRAAIRIAASGTAQLDSDNAANWAKQQLAEPAIGKTRMLFHTIAWQYFDAQTKKETEKTIRDAGKAATEQTPLAWLSVEGDTEKPAGASVHLTIWPGGRKRQIARASYHGEWIHTS